MASIPTIRHFGVIRDNPVVMADPKQFLLATCVRLAQEIAGICPSAKQKCDELSVYLEAAERAFKVAGQSYQSQQDYSHCRTIYDAIVEALRLAGEPMKESELYEALIAGHAPKSKLAGFRGNFRKALSNRERTEVAVEAGETGNLADRVIRLRPTTEKIPPKRS
jgi:hypothetical protein